MISLVGEEGTGFTCTVSLKRQLYIFLGGIHSLYNWVVFVGHVHVLCFIYLFLKIFFGH